MSGLSVRPYVDSDQGPVLELMQASLGWRPEDPNRAFFLWKHRENAYGRSPGWVAVADGHVVGFRTFLRWEFERGGDVVRAVRAVDTATHPDHQGRGIFRRLTLQALDDLQREGVDFVFNTPNEQSRPGYLKMGWRPVGRLPVAFRPRSLGTLPALVRARAAADLWSQPTAAGEPAVDVLTEPGVAELLRSQPPVHGLRTRRTPASMRWRYGFGPLHYRVLLAGRTVEDGVVVFRLRRRGAATEAAVADVLLPPGRSARGLVARVLRAAKADYAVALRPAPAGMLALPSPGPLLVWRAVGAQDMPALPLWHLTLGDVELF